MVKVILINGPPNCGKDTAATVLDNYINNKYTQGKLIPHRTKKMKFAAPLKKAAHELYGIPYSCEYYEEKYGNEWKNQPQPEFFGEKPRDVYIDLSEKFAKKRAGGETHFGKIAARSIRLEKSANCFIFSDSGFDREAEPIIECAEISNVVVLQIERPGCSFVGDSRGYIADKLLAQFPKLKVQRIPNMGDKMLYRTLLHGFANDWLNLEIKDAD